MIEKIKKLRAETGAPLESVRRALARSQGDEQAARRLIAKFGQERVAAKASRQARSGIVEVYGHLGKIGVVMEVNCETDFVARNEEFKDFVHDLAMQAAATNPASVKELIGQPFIKDEAKTVADLLGEVTGKLGEKIVVGRFKRFELGRE